MHGGEPVRQSSIAWIFQRCRDEAEHTHGVLAPQPRPCEVQGEAGMRGAPTIFPNAMHGASTWAWA